MDAIKMLEERRSVRRYTDEKVPRELMREVVDISRWAPSWANFQIARYTLVDDEATIQRIAEQGLNGFVYNANTLKNAQGVAVLSYVKGKSGKLEGKPGVDSVGYVTSKDSSWEVFDAGIACQTFCLAAHAKGVGTCIFGVIDDAAIAEIVALPEDETVAALITYGFEAGEHANPTPRKGVDDILRFI